jgi:uncharacterized membrane protein
MWPMVRFDVIGDAWRLYRRHPGIWSLAILIVLIGYSTVSNAVFALVGLDGPVVRGGFRLTLTPGAGALHYVITSVIGGFFVGGLIRMASNQVRGRAPRIKDLVSVMDVGLELVLAATLYGAATFVGSMLCVIPGVIVSGLLMLAIPLVVIARQPATAAIGRSWNVLLPQWLTATVFHFVLVLLSGSGFLLCCVGIFFTAPLYSLSIAILYHEFFSASHEPTWKKRPIDPFPEF